MIRKFLSATFLVTVCTGAWAATPSEYIAARQDSFKQMGRAQKAISDELRKPNPNLNVIRGSANTIALLGAQVGRWFPRGSGKESGVKTGALAAIWQQGGR